MNMKRMIVVWLVMMLLMGWMTGVANISVEASNVNQIRVKGITIYVDGDFIDNPTNHKWNTIQDGINDANDWDTVYVFSGIYHEHITITKTISLIGEGSDATIIDGNATGDAVNLTASEIFVSGFTIKNSSATFGNSGAVFYYSNDNIIQHCKIINNKDGIRLFSSSNNTIRDCIITDNTDDGISLEEFSDSNTITNCTISNNFDTGVEVGWYASNNNISNNIIEGSSFGIFLSCRSNVTTIFNCTLLDNYDGIYVQRSYENTITHCTIQANREYGICLYKPPWSVSEYNYIHHNNFLNNDNQAFDDGTNYWDDGTEGNFWSDYIEKDVDGDGIGDEPYTVSGGSNQDRYPLIGSINIVSLGSVYNVNKSKYYNMILSAIRDADAGNTVYIYSGIYYEKLEINKTINIVGEDRNTTIIDSGGVIDTIKITASYVNITELTIKNSGPFEYAAINLESVQYCHIQNCNFENNKNGVVFNTATNNTITNCTMFDSGYAINFQSATHNFVINCNIQNSYYAIYLWSSNSNNIVNCNLTNNNQGIEIRSSIDNIFRDNRIYNSTYYNLGILSGYNQSIDSSNTINDKPIYYLINHNDEVWDGTTHDIAYLALVSSNNITVRNLKITHNSPAVVFANTTNSIIENCNFSNNNYGLHIYDSSNISVVNSNICSNLNGGIHLSHSKNIFFSNCTLGANNYGFEFVASDNNIVTNCTISNNFWGVYIRSSMYNMITNSTLTNNSRNLDFSDASDNAFINCIISGGEYGIFIRKSSNNIIRNNVILHNHFGLYVWRSSNNTIKYCNISVNDYGIYVYEDSNNNWIYHNNIISNTQQAYDECSNYWDKGYPSGGNYWSDYVGVDITGAGLGHIPYDISGGDNKDNYPFTTLVPINRAPELTNIAVYPNTGDETIEFTFIVTYVDFDGDAPLYVYVIIDNVPHDMMIPFGNYTTGVIYEYKTKLNVGTHQYKFECDDGSGTNTSTASTSINYLTVTEKPVAVSITLIYVIIIITVIIAAVYIVKGIRRGIRRKRKKTSTPQTHPHHSTSMDLI